MSKRWLSLPSAIVLSMLTSLVLQASAFSQNAAASAAEFRIASDRAGVPDASAVDTVQASHAVTQAVDKGSYILGPGDRMTIQVFGADDFPNLPVEVDSDGAINAPMLGRVQVSGISVQTLEANLAHGYTKFFRNPEVSVTVTDYRSQPVTVIGSVNTPGVIQLRRPTRLMEVISEAGGLRADAGDKVLITRQSAPNNAIGDPGSGDDRKFLSRDIDLRKIIEGTDPSENVLVHPHDLITIPKAKMVYVVGEVGRPGGYVLDGHSSTLSVLQAIALAGGLTKTAKANETRILTPGPEDSSKRQETTIDLRRILSSKAPDVNLHADDILFVPNSNSKSAGIRALQMALDVGTGLAIWRF
ncbi:MAG TPA: polysaccharide biosynthesis/export family protein [Acidobacteriaceae bacterium]|jgi:polysaccharide export outer membrane protein|nr:polysaccharide biosynthesis/export family protein [Acidobacteriaceae bacterium]